MTDTIHTPADLRLLVHESIREHRRHLAFARKYRAAIILAVGAVCWLPVVLLVLFAAGVL